MKRTTITIKTNPRVSGEEAGSLEVSGYAAELAGFPVVIHRPVAATEDGPALSDKGWTVSEPQTGLAIHRGYAGETREMVLAGARDRVERIGGQDAFSEAIRANLEEIRPKGR